MLGEATVPPARASQGELALSRKLDPYLVCLAEQSPSVFDARRHYLSWSGSGSSAPRCDRPFELQELPSSADCLSELERARTMQPGLPDLERAANAYAGALSRMVELLASARASLRSDAPRRDRCVRAVDLHGQLIAGWEHFAAADGRLRDSVEHKQALLREHELARTLARFGRGLRYFHKRTEITAARALWAARKHSRAPRASLEMLTTVLAEYEATVQALEKAAKRNPRATRDVFFWDSFVAQAREFLGAIKELYGRVKTGRSFDEKESARLDTGFAHWVDGSYAKVAHEYEELQRISGNLELGTAAK